MLIGCTVHAYDHTIKSLPATSFPHKIHWHKVGMASNNDKSDLKTLGYLIGQNGHSNDNIQYLKVSSDISAFLSSFEHSVLDFEFKLTFW